MGKKKYDIKTRPWQVHNLALSKDQLVTSKKQSISDELKNIILNTKGFTKQVQFLNTVALINIKIVLASTCKFQSYFCNTINRTNMFWYLRKQIEVIACPMH